MILINLPPGKEQELWPVSMTIFFEDKINRMLDEKCCDHMKDSELRHQQLMITDDHLVIQGAGDQVED